MMNYVEYQLNVLNVLFNGLNIWNLFFFFFFYENAEKYLYVQKCMICGLLCCCFLPSIFMLIEANIFYNA